MRGHTPYTRPCTPHSTVPHNRHGVFTVRYKKNIRLTLSSTALPWLRRLVVGLSQWRPRFDLISVHVRFVVESGNGAGFFPGSLVGPVTVIQPMSHTQLHLHDALTNKVKWAKHADFPKDSTPT